MKGDILREEITIVLGNVFLGKTQPSLFRKGDFLSLQSRAHSTDKRTPGNISRARARALLLSSSGVDDPLDYFYFFSFSEIQPSI